MSAVNPSTISFTIKLESEDYAPEDSEWQEECHKFYLQLKNALDTGTVEPLKVENKEKGYRNLLAQIKFDDLITHLSGEMLLGLPATIKCIYNFLRHKRNIEISLEPSDGRGFVPRFSWRAKDMKDLRNNDDLYNALCDKHCLEKKPCTIKECFIHQIKENSRLIILA